MVMCCVVPTRNDVKSNDTRYVQQQRYTAVLEVGSKRVLEVRLHFGPGHADFYSTSHLLAVGAISLVTLDLGFEARVEYVFPLSKIICLRCCSTLVRTQQQLAGRPPVLTVAWQVRDPGMVLIFFLFFLLS